MRLAQAAHRTAPWLVACVAASSPGCTKKPTALVLAIAAEPAARASIDRVRVEVTRRGQARFANDYELDPSGRPLPGTLTIVDDGAGDPEDPVRVDVIGTKLGVERVRRRSIVGFAEGRVMLVRTLLQQDCVDVTCADADSTCDRGACVSAVVDQATLSEFTTNDDAIATVSSAGGAAGTGGAGGAAGVSGTAAFGGKAGTGGAAGKAGAAGSAGVGGAAGTGGAGANAGAAGSPPLGGAAGSGGSAGSGPFPSGLVHCWVGQNMGKDVVGGNDAVVHADVKLAPDALGVGFECGPTAGPGTGVDTGQKPNLSPTGPWTVELFVQRKAAVSDVWVLDRTGAALSLASLYVDASSKWSFNVRFSDHPAAPSALSAGSVPTGTWSHLALTWDGAAFTTYNQGSVVQALPKASVPGGGAFVFDPPRWCGHPTAGNGFGGVVQAVRIWSRALTPAEVASVAAGNRSCGAL